jgi:hypothetical protein
MASAAGDVAMVVVLMRHTWRRHRALSPLGGGGRDSEMGGERCDISGGRERGRAAGGCLREGAGARRCGRPP